MLHYLLTMSKLIKVFSKGHQRSLNLNTFSSVYIGGTKNTQSGLQGCVRELILNARSVDLSKDFIEAKNYGSCYKYTSPCLSQPCLHKSSCHMVSSTTFRCVCSSDYKGEFCETKIKKCGQFPDCLNEGKCILREGKHGRFCMCPIGFGGFSCEQGMLYNKKVIFERHANCLAY